MEILGPINRCNQMKQRFLSCKKTWQAKLDLESYTMNSGIMYIGDNWHPEWFKKFPCILLPEN